MGAAAEGKAIPPVPPVDEKAPSSSAKGPTQSEVSQSALVTLHRQPLVAGSGFPVAFIKDRN